VTDRRLRFVRSKSTHLETCSGCGGLVQHADMEHASEVLQQRRIARDFHQPRASASAALNSPLSRILIAGPDSIVRSACGRGPAPTVSARFAMRR